MSTDSNFYDFRPRAAHLEKGKGAAPEPVRDDGEGISKSTLKLYKSFMQSYVKRINDATFNVTIGGIRIGSAKYTRLAQINLKSKVITFSRFAIENVPERGRRYLVLHELAHVHEASHNHHFWNLVGRHEPDYKDVGIDLDRAFKKNVNAHEKFMRRRQKGGGELILPDQNNLIWTPDHGYVQQGSPQYGLHKDPVENFLQDVNGQADEAFRAYVDLQLENDMTSDLDFDIQETELESESELELEKTDNQPCQFEYAYEDDYDNYCGTISGGECLV